MSGLKSSDIHWVVQSYIGTTDGYLGDLTYRSHREFYPAYCDVEVDPDSFPGRTTREKFLSILAASEPRIQAAILRGVVKKYPPGSEHQRTPPAAARLRKIVTATARVPLRPSQASALAASAIGPILLLRARHATPDIVFGRRGAVSR